VTAGLEPVAIPAPTWWRRPGLDVVDDRLTVDGADLEALARQHGAPLFVYDLARPVENVRALQGALDRAGVRHVVRYALKASPDPRILAVLRSLGAPGEPGSIGIDACSPGEVLHALANGWQPEEISHTGTNVSERDLDVLLAHPIRINLDAVSQIERLGRRAPGRTIGIRINPGAGAGYTDKLAYAGDRPTKFGVGEDRFDDAIDAIRRHGLVVDTLHFHAGSGWLGDQLNGFEAALVRAIDYLDRLLDAGFPINEVNVGGGLGVVARDGERPIDLDAYAAVVARHLGPYDVTAAFEPGDLVMKDAAVSSGAATRRSSASTSAGTSTARTSSTSTRRRSFRSGRRCGRVPGSSRSPDTSTRRATCSRRTTRSQTSRRARWSRS
jgi:diaminopimelate decarboxylase